jgi:hypothetical protein
LGTPPKPAEAARKGIFDELENWLTSGYGKKEDLRALDKAIRDQYYGSLVTLRHKWEKIYLQVIEAGQTTIARGCKTTIQTMDHLAESVNRADYGYAPIFDRVEKIQGETLQKMLDYDRGLDNGLLRLSQDVANAESALKASTWPVLNGFVDTINEDLRSIEDDWSKRKQLMRS